VEDGFGRVGHRNNNELNQDRLRVQLSYSLINTHVLARFNAP
jgi:hypothetical protein